MHALEVIVNRNRAAAYREESDTFEDGQYALSGRIREANDEADREEADARHEAVAA